MPNYLVVKKQSITFAAVKQVGRLEVADNLNRNGIANPIKEVPCQSAASLDGNF